MLIPMSLYLQEYQMLHPVISKQEKKRTRRKTVKPEKQEPEQAATTEEIEVSRSSCVCLAVSVPRLWVLCWLN